jgi:hypothetical protein
MSLPAVRASGVVVTGGFGGLRGALVGARAAVVRLATTPLQGQRPPRLQQTDDGPVAGRSLQGEHPVVREARRRGARSGMLTRVVESVRVSVHGGLQCPHAVLAGQRKSR